MNYEKEISIVIRNNLKYISKHSVKLILKIIKRRKIKKIRIIRKQSTILLSLTNKVIYVYNGMRWYKKFLSPWSMGFKFGEFIRTRKPAIYKANQKRKQKIKEEKKRQNIIKGLRHKASRSGEARKELDIQLAKSKESKVSKKTKKIHLKLRENLKTFKRVRISSSAEGILFHAGISKKIKLKKLPIKMSSEYL